MQFYFQVDLVYKEVLKKQSSTKIYNANYFADLQPETLLFISLSSSLGIPVFMSIRMCLEGSVPCLRISTGTALWFSLCSEESILFWCSLSRPAFTFSRRFLEGSVSCLCSTLNLSSCRMYGWYSVPCLNSSTVKKKNNFVKFKMVRNDVWIHIFEESL